MEAMLELAEYFARGVTSKTRAANLLRLTALTITVTFEQRLVVQLRYIKRSVRTLYAKFWKQPGLLSVLTSD